MKEELYVSTDVETNGPCPGLNSMLSFGSAVYRASGEMIGTFTANLFELPGSKPDQKTMDWWETQPEAWAAHRTNIRLPDHAMVDYYSWLVALPGKPVFVAYPAGFDFTFIYWYLCRFAGGCPLGFSALDMKTYAMCLLKLPYRQSTKKVWPKEWSVPHKHTHLALDDAIEQGAQFIKMLNRR